MPLTPFHLGPGLLFGVLFLRFINIFAFLIGSVIMDLEPLILILIKQCYYCPHHGFWHSIIGALLGSFIIAILLKIFAKPLQKLSLRLKIKQLFSFPVLYFSSLTAWLLHISFDSLTHSDVFPFWPSEYNPILIGPRIMLRLHIILFVLGIMGLVLVYTKFSSNRKAKRKAWGKGRPSSN